MSVGTAHMAVVGVCGLIAFIALVVVMLCLEAVRQGRAVSCKIKFAMFGLSFCIRFSCGPETTGKSATRCDGDGPGVHHAS
jgi:hypothetical protein